MRSRRCSGSASQEPHRECSRGVIRNHGDRGSAGPGSPCQPDGAYTGRRLQAPRLAAYPVRSRRCPDLRAGERRCGQSDHPRDDRRVRALRCYFPTQPCRMATQRVQSLRWLKVVGAKPTSTVRDRHRMHVVRPSRFHAAISPRLPDEGAAPSADHHPTVRQVRCVTDPSMTSIERAWQFWAGTVLPFLSQ